MPPPGDSIRDLFGMVNSRDPNSRGWIVTSNDRGWKGHGLNHLAPMFAPEKWCLEDAAILLKDGLILKGRPIKLPGSMRGLPGSIRIIMEIETDPNQPK